jgi:mannitol/fructose-specific phosphotransferase system IIA component (Ntr-type)
MKLSELLDESRIVLAIPASAPKEEVLALLTRTAVGANGSTARPFVDDLRDREKSMSTGIGQGVAIPHTHTKCLDKPLSALGVSPEGIDWDAVDGEPVHIIFLLITPDSQPLLHVETLGEMASLFGDEAVRCAVTTAASPKAALDVIRSNEGHSITDP